VRKDPIVDLLRAGAGADALRLLLTEWRRTRGVRLARAILALGERSDADPASALAGREGAGAHNGWVDLVRDTPDEALTPLLGSLVDHVRRARFAWPILERLAERPPDPRIGAAAVELLAQPDRIAGPSDRLTRRLLLCVERHGDAVMAGRLEGKVAPHGRLDRVVARMAPSTDDLTTTDLDATLAAMAEARLVAPAASTGPTLGEALLAAVYADPVPDGPREVYGDWLAERGDPRGAFVALQFRDHRGTLDARGRRRMEQLQREHQREWLAPIWPALQGNLRRPAAPLRFERGFLASAEVVRPRRPPTDLWDRVEWATVRSVRGAPVLTPALRSLEEVVCDVDRIWEILPVERRIPRLRLVHAWQHWGSFTWPAVDGSGVDVVEIEVISGRKALTEVARLVMTRGSSGRYEHLTVRVGIVERIAGILAPFRTRNLSTLTLVAPAEASAAIAAAADGCAAEVFVRPADAITDSR
jgi:uncharacterized protein (TIGR02996 family)